MIRSPPQSTAAAPNSCQDGPKKSLPTIMMRSRLGGKRTADFAQASPPKTYQEPSPVKEIYTTVEIKSDETKIMHELTPMQLPTHTIPMVKHPSSAYEVKDDEEIDVTGMDFIDYGELLTQARTTTGRNRPNSSARDVFTTRLNAVKNSASTSSSYQNSPIDVVTVDEDPHEETIQSQAAKRAKMVPVRAQAAPSKPQKPPSTTTPHHQQPQQYPSTSIRNVSLVDDDDDENFLKPIKITYLNEDGTEESESMNGTFFCDKCPAMFRSRVGLTNHKKKHGANDMYRCNLCDFSCKNKKTTRYHRKVHMEMCGDGNGYEDDE